MKGKGSLCLAVMILQSLGKISFKKQKRNEKMTVNQGGNIQQSVNAKLRGAVFIKYFSPE